VTDLSLFEKSALAARKEFIEADAAYKEANEALKEADLDIAIAERGGSNVEEAKAARSKIINDLWHPAFKGRKDAGQKLAAALGVDPDSLRSALQ
jgi:hypothetical protein